jgi:hypothetical protein
MLFLYLALGLLDYSGWLLGRGGDAPADSASGTDFLLSDCSGDLLLMLGVLPLKLLLRRALILLELLRRVARETGAIAAPRLRPTNLVLAILHLLTLLLYHDCSVDQVLKCGEGMVHQLIMQGIDQALKKRYYLLAPVLTSSGA